MRLQSILQRTWTELRGQRPPPVPPGWDVAPPNFVGVGTQRSGTTWWYEIVSAHPGAQPAPHKELHYLHRFWRRPFTDADAHAYARFFPRPPGRLTGEWSPGYLSHFWIPPLLQRAAPDARLLVLLRDPVERYRSGLALQLETSRPSAAHASRAFRLGCYASQLEHLFGYFSPEQVLILQFERCLGDPKAELARTYRFLGLDDGFVPVDVSTARNASNACKPDLTPDVHAALIAAYEPEVRRLPSLVPDLDLALWRNFADIRR